MIKYYSREQGQPQPPTEALGRPFRMFPGRPARTFPGLPFDTLDNDFFRARDEGNAHHRPPLVMYGPVAGFRPCGTDGIMMRDYSIRTGPPSIAGKLDKETQDFGFYTGSRDDCLVIAALQYRAGPVSVADRYLFAHFKSSEREMTEAAALFRRHFGDSWDTTFAVVVHKDWASINYMIELMAPADDLLGMLCYRTDGATFAMGVSHGTMGWCGELTMAQLGELAG